MEILQNISLLPYNTFRIDVKAKYFVEINSTEDLRLLVSTDEFKSNAKFVLGGGSNLLIADEGFPGVVIHVVLLGIKDKTDGA
ncbi:MAG: UDP-N-acetylenolpyruvoylglucosamine reductase, partial [Bacteroidia bacterium]